MSKQKSNHAAAAGMIRAELKKHGIACRVRSSIYAGGTSVDVTILQDVVPATKNEIKAFCNQFSYGHFDGMTDCYQYSSKRSDLPQVKYVSVDFHYSAEILAAAREYVGQLKGETDYTRDRLAWDALQGDYMDFWSNRKPRIRTGGVQ